jgi:hypothetical protein
MNKNRSRYFADRAIIPLLFVLDILLSRPADSPIYVFLGQRRVAFRSLCIASDKKQNIKIYQKNVDSKRQKTPRGGTPFNETFGSLDIKIF